MFSSASTTTTAPAAQQQRTPSPPRPVLAETKPPAEEPPLGSMPVNQLRAIAKQLGVVLDHLGDKGLTATWVTAIHQARQAQQKTEEEAQQKTEEEAQQKTDAEEQKTSAEAEAPDPDVVSSPRVLTVTASTDAESKAISALPTDAVLDALAATFGRPVGHIEEALFGDDAVQPGESFKDLGIEVTVTPCCCLSPSPSPHTDSSSSDSLPLLCSCVAGRGEARRALQGGQGDGGGSGGRDD